MNEKKHAVLELDSISENIDDDIPRPRTKTKSVRTTFTVYEVTIKIMEILKQKYEMSPKSILDFIMDSGDFVKVLPTFSEKLSHGDGNHVKKSVVLSERTLDRLSKMARDTKVARNTLFTGAIHLTEAILSYFAEKRQEECRKALKIIDTAQDAILKAEGELCKILKPDDPILTRWGKVSVVADNAYFAIKDEADGGESVDPNDL